MARTKQTARCSRTHDERVRHVEFHKLLVTFKQLRRTVLADERMHEVWARISATRPCPDSVRPLDDPRTWEPYYNPFAGIIEIAQYHEYVQDILRQLKHEYARIAEQLGPESKPFAEVVAERAEAFERLGSVDASNIMSDTRRTRPSAKAQAALPVERSPTLRDQLRTP